MAIAAAAPNLFLCENLTIDFAQTAQAHHTVGVIWRVAAVVCVVAASVLATFLLITGLSEFALAFDALFIYGAISAFTLLAFRSFWIAGTDEFAQSAFYSRVAVRVELRANMELPDIEDFFNAHAIQFPNQPAVQELLQERVAESEDYLRAFIPSIAHFETLQAELTPLNTPIERMQNGLDQLNLAMILQSMHRPVENRQMKLDNRFIDTIPGIGKVDKMSVIKELSEKDDCPAFIFEGDRYNESLSIKQLNKSAPAAIRREIFELLDPNLNEPD